MNAIELNVSPNPDLAAVLADLERATLDLADATAFRESLRGELSQEEERLRWARSEARALTQLPKQSEAPRWRTVLVAMFPFALFLRP